MDQQYTFNKSGKFENQLNNYYTSSAQLQTYAEKLNTQYNAVAQSAGLMASMGMDQGFKAADLILQSGQQRSGVIRMAAAQSGITAASLRETMTEQSRLDLTTSRMRQGAQTASYTGAGLSVTDGSPTLLIQETTDSNLRELKSSFLNMSTKQAEVRQQQMNLVTESLVNEQVARQNANIQKASTIQNILQAQLRMA